MQFDFSDITVAISTYSFRIKNALEIAKKFKTLGFDVLIVHQFVDDFRLYESILDDIEAANIKYYHLNSHGVAKSRNKAIEISDKEFIWFMDDDIELLYENLENVKSILNNPLYAGFGAFLFSVLDEDGVKRKKYIASSNVGIFGLLNAGTIEILCNRKLISKNSIFFNENFGAGTSLPLGDESIFLSKVKKISKIARFDLALLIHPKESSGTVWDHSHFLSKKKSFKIIFGSFFGFILYIIFLVKKRCFF